MWVNVFIGSCPYSKIFSRLSSFPPSTKIILSSSKFDPASVSAGVCSIDNHLQSFCVLS